MHAGNYLGWIVNTLVTNHKVTDMLIKLLCIHVTVENNIYPIRANCDRKCYRMIV